MIGIFKQKSPGNIIVLLIFGLLLKTPMFLYPKAIVATDNDGTLYRFLIESLPLSQTGYAIVTFILLYAQALLINYLVNEYRMIPRQNYLPAMAYLLITSLLPAWNYMSSPLLANTLIIWMFIKLFRLYNTPNAKGAVYNIGLIAGVASYIYFPSAIFALCVIIGLMILKPFRLNEVLLFLLGGLTPYYFFAIWLFLHNRLNLVNFFPHVSVRIPVMKSTIWVAASTLLLAVPFLLGGYFVQTHIRKMLIQVRKNWSILLVYLVVAFFVPFINSDGLFYTWILVTVPFAAFHTCAYYYATRKWLPLFLFFVSVGYVLYVQYWTDVWK